MRKHVSAIYWVVLAISITAALISGCLLPLAKGNDEMHSVLFNILLMSIPVGIAELITIIHQRYDKKDESYCAYKEYLEEIGIIKIYEKRENPKIANCPRYIDDLSYDLDHLGTKPQTIKMMGVALIFYFRESDGYDAQGIATKIREQSKRHTFQALVCDESSEELTRRNAITMKMGYTSENNQKATIDILADIEKSKTIVRGWKSESSKKLNIIFKKFLNALIALI